MMKKQNEHGMTVQLNIYTLDIDSDITGYGKHNRLIMTYGSDEIIIREDLQGLPLSTWEDRQRVYMGKRRMHPVRSKLTFSHSSEPYSGDGYMSIDHVYKIER